VKEAELTTEAVKQQHETQSVHIDNQQISNSPTEISMQRVKPTNEQPQESKYRIGTRASVRLDLVKDPLSDSSVSNTLGNFDL
jgi:hypothetical protein